MTWMAATGFWNLLNQLAAAAAARPGGAAVAVIADLDRSLSNLIEGQRCDVKPVAGGVKNRHLKHLVEVAVVDRSVPADADQIAAHDLLQGCRIEVAFEQFSVTVVFAAELEMGGVARDRHVGEAIKMIERDAEFFTENLFIILFELVLRWRQMRADGIVNQIQNQIVIGLTVAYFV